MGLTVTVLGTEPALAASTAPSATRIRSGVPAGASAIERTHGAAGLHHRVAAGQGRRRSERGSWARRCAMSRSIRSRVTDDAAPGPGRAAGRTSVARRAIGRQRIGQHGRRGEPAQPGLLGGHPAGQRPPGPCLAAARPAAVRRPRRAPPACRRRSGSNSGRRRRRRRSGGPARGRWRTPPGCGSWRPPGTAPRRRTAADPRRCRRRGRCTMTSTSGSASSLANDSIIWVTADTPCTAGFSTRNRTAGQRARALASTSDSAALARPVIRPTTPRQERQPLLALGGGQALGGQQPPQPLQPGQQLAEPDRVDLVDPEAQRAAGRVELEPAVHDHPGPLGRRRVSARSAWSGSRPPAATSSTDGSRRVRNDICDPDRIDDLGDLSLHPRGRRLGHVFGHPLRQRPHRPGVLPGGVAGLGRWSRDDRAVVPGRAAAAHECWASRVTSRLLSRVRNGARLSPACSYCQQGGDLLRRQFPQVSADLGQGHPVVAGQRRPDRRRPPSSDRWALRTRSSASVGGGRRLGRH